MLNVVTAAHTRRTRSTSRSSWSCPPAPRRLPRPSRSARGVHALKGLLHERWARDGGRRRGRFRARPRLQRGGHRGRLRPRPKRAGHAERVAIRARSRRHGVLERRRLQVRRSSSWIEEAMVEYWIALADQYPIVSIEDALAEDEWASWRGDLLSGERRPAPARRRRSLRNERRPAAAGDRRGVANAILVKLNQIGTLTETLETIELARQARLRHRHLAPFRRDRGHDDRGRRRRDQRRPDQDGRAFAVGSRREVQPALRIEEELGDRRRLSRLGRLHAFADSARTPRYAGLDALSGSAPHEDRRHARTCVGRPQIGGSSPPGQMPSGSTSAHGTQSRHAEWAGAVRAWSGESPPARVDGRPTGAEAAHRRSSPLP